MKSSLFVPIILGIPTLCSIFLFIVYVGSQLKMIHWKNYLTTFVVLSILFSLFFYVWLYIFMDSVSSICKSKSKEETKRDNSWIGKYLSTLLLIGIFGMLWIVDSKKWNRYECIFYLIVTILLFTSFSSISVNYPNSSLLSFWLLIEWILVTYSNWLNVKNSFHCIFAND
jgi:phosphatidylglycerophosphate synthase